MKYHERNRDKNDTEISESLASDNDSPPFRHENQEKSQSNFDYAEDPVNKQPSRIASRIGS